MNVATLIGVTVGVVGLLVAVITLWVNLQQYLLQRRGHSGQPGAKVNPTRAARVLDSVTEDPVRKIAANHIFVESGKKAVGYIDRHPIGVYLDMHSAACITQEKYVLADSLAAYIEKVDPGDKSRIIASPREGNVLVTSAAAEKLGAGFLMIRTGRAPRFGYPIEGQFTPGATVILADDLCMEGSFLGRCVQYLRRYGLNVSDCVCLFERLDGDAREGLEAVSVKLHSKYQIDDEQLIKLKFPVPPSPPA